MKTSKSRFESYLPTPPVHISPQWNRKDGPFLGISGKCCSYEITPAGIRGVKRPFSTAITSRPCARVEQPTGKTPQACVAHAIKSKRTGDGITKATHKA